MRKIIATLTVVIATTIAVLAGSSAHASSHNNDTMTEARAGQVYLTQICSTNAAIDRLNDALPLRANHRWHSRDLKGHVFTDVKRATRNMRDVTQSVSSRLFNPPKDWPNNVAWRVQRMASGYARESVIYRDLSLASTGRQFARIWDRLDNVSYLSRISGQIRARLNLPPVGRGC